MQSPIQTPGTRDANSGPSLAVKLCNAGIMSNRARQPRRKWTSLPLPCQLVCSAKQGPFNQIIITRVTDSQMGPSFQCVLQLIFDALRNLTSSVNVNINSKSNSNSNSTSIHHLSCHAKASTLHSEGSTSVSLLVFVKLIIALIVEGQADFSGWSQLHLNPGAACRAGRTYSNSITS